VINSYVEYIDSYMSTKGLASLKEPGEHHFGSTYLAPKLHSINGKVPDYVNPDGTKSILGDIVYYKKGKYSLGIEVKLGTIRLTANEFNSWIINEDTNEHPCAFIGIGLKGLVFQSWARFRKTYLAMIDVQNVKEIGKGKYGPQRRVNVLLEELKKDDKNKGVEYFPWEMDAENSSAWEVKFDTQLKKRLKT